MPKDKQTLKKIWVGILFLFGGEFLYVCRWGVF